MKDNTAILWVLAALVAIWYLLTKSNPTGAGVGIGTAATTSPLGSASGVLTPVSASTGILSGLEAFQESLAGAGPGQSIPQIQNTLTTQAVDQSLSLSSGDAIDYGAAYEAPTSAPEISTPDQTGTDYLAGVGL